MSRSFIKTWDESGAGYDDCEMLADNSGYRERSRSEVLHIYSPAPSNRAKTSHPMHRPSLTEKGLYVLDAFTVASARMSWLNTIHAVC